MTDFSPDVGKVALTISEFCRRYGIGKTKAYELLAEGRLTAVKVGSKTLIRVADADAFLKSLPPARFHSNFEVA